MWPHLNRQVGAKQPLRSSHHIPFPKPRTLQSKPRRLCRHLLHSDPLVPAPITMMATSTRPKSLLLLLLTRLALRAAADSDARRGDRWDGTPRRINLVSDKFTDNAIRPSVVRPMSDPAACACIACVPPSSSVRPSSVRPSAILMLRSGKAIAHSII